MAELRRATHPSGKSGLPPCSDSYVGLSRHAGLGPGVHLLSQLAGGGVCPGEGEDHIHQHPGYSPPHLTRAPSHTPTHLSFLWEVCKASAGEISVFIKSEGKIYELLTGGKQAGRQSNAALEIKGQMLLSTDRRKRLRKTPPAKQSRCWGKTILGGNAGLADALQDPTSLLLLWLCHPAGQLALAPFGGAEPPKEGGSEIHKHSFQVAAAPKGGE